MVGGNLTLPGVNIFCKTSCIVIFILYEPMFEKTEVYWCRIKSGISRLPENIYLHIYEEYGTDMVQERQIYLVAMYLYEPPPLSPPLIKIPSFDSVFNLLTRS